MPMIRTWDGTMTCQEAARRLRREKVCVGNVDWLAQQLRMACDGNKLLHRRQPFGAGNRVARLVKYYDVVRFIEEHGMGKEGNRTTEQI